MIKRGLIKVIILILLTNMFIGYSNTVSYADDTVDGIISSADKFIKDGEKQTAINEGKLKNTSNFLYNLLLGVGIIIAVIVGIILGIKYMMGSVEEKAEYKESLFAYAVGCVVVFGAFGIWKIVVNILVTI
ncbi:MAG: hypothetical protein HFJ40_08565 [Clostridia bacterium]|nr:hypothetical protein [Clostridia bacterium]